MAFTPWAAGQRITAARLAAMTPLWSAWTPTWTTSTGVGTPSYGNATVDCKYAQSGDTVFYEMEITFGTTTNFGGGGSNDNWRFSAPVTAAEPQLITGTGEIQGSSVAERYPIRARLDTTTTFQIELTGRSYNNETPNSSGLIDAATPFGTSNSISTAWANGFRILLDGKYQAA
ncbi:hypothetical protein ACH40E_02840 [Streptomyces acidicola]|uniref:hypothetical protein n=1 Tax=Streptomyces acidicola TaxID=2596892 RepID=UPI0037B5D206